jgi:hypothetical protein
MVSPLSIAIYFRDMVFLDGRDRIFPALPIICSQSFRVAIAGNTYGYKFAAAL